MRSELVLQGVQLFRRDHVVHPGVGDGRRSTRRRRGEGSCDDEGGGTTRARPPRSIAHGEDVTKDAC
jgi:hypothetical protein